MEATHLDRVEGPVDDIQDIQLVLAERAQLRRREGLGLKGPDKSGGAA